MRDDPASGRRPWRYLAVALLGIAIATPAQASGAPGAHASAAGSNGGLVRDEACDGFRVRGPRSVARCTHGPDPPPPGVDVRRRRSVAELAASTAPADPAAIGCHGDGASGPRVHMIYGRPADRPDRYAQVAPLIEQWAADMAARVEQSAQETGAVRTIRFVTSSCRLVVSNVVLSPSADDDDIGAMATELEQLGYDRDDRRYVVFLESNRLCGIAYVNWRYARADEACWDGHTGLHELAHTIGAVDASGPNATRGWHCTDEHDVMCYSDSPDFPPMRLICPEWHEALLDCGHDDYFHGRPPAGNHLSARPDLDTADSPFLAAEDGYRPVYLPPPPASYRGPHYVVRLDNADDDLCAYGLAASGRVRFVCVGYRGTREVDVTGALLVVAAGARSAQLRLVATDRGGGRTYGFRVMRDDGAVLLDDRDGEVGVWSSDAPLGPSDPLTGWPTFYERTLTLDLNSPPIAAIEASPQNPMAGDTVVLQSRSTDHDGAIASESWDLDADGAYDDASGATVTHRFAAPGAYAVHLRVLDDAGAAATASATIHVSEEPTDGSSSQTEPDGGTFFPQPGGSFAPPEAGGLDPDCDAALERLRFGERSLGALERRLNRDYRRLRRWYRRLARAGWPARESRRYARSLRRFRAAQRRHARLVRRVDRLVDEAYAACGS